MTKKVLILKNDRAGDLFTSLPLISSILSTHKDIKIYLSELNSGFSFLLNKANIKKINFDLSISNKVFIFFDILINKYEKIYILSPKIFIYIAIYFRQTKFYAVVYDGTKAIDPQNFYVNLFTNIKLYLGVKLIKKVIVNYNVI